MKRTVDDPAGRLDRFAGEYEDRGAPHVTEPRDSGHASADR